MKRSYGRSHDAMRPISISYNFLDYTAGSVLYELGRTKVLCAVTLNNHVPYFLKGKKTGWLTAEYSMLPAATQRRTDREASTMKRNGRSVEISRLIGRSFRAIVDLEKLGEQTIVIDCDVLQADGSTRTACITAAYLALKKAVERWERNGLVQEGFLRDEIAAVSVGLMGSQPLLDIDFAEDSRIDADFNFVMTKGGDIIELQGSAEKMPISWKSFEWMKDLAFKGIQAIFNRPEQKQKKEEAKKDRQVFNAIRFKEV